MYLLNEYCSIAFETSNDRILLYNEPRFFESDLAKFFEPSDTRKTTLQNNMFRVLTSLCISFVTYYGLHPIYHAGEMYLFSQFEIEAVVRCLLRTDRMTSRRCSVQNWGSHPIAAQAR